MQNNALRSSAANTPFANLEDALNAVKRIGATVNADLARVLLYIILSLDELKDRN